MSDGIELTAPAGASPGTWRLLAHNKRVMKGWDALCQRIPENCARCFAWLSADPQQRIPGRCYPLRHKNYVERNVWAYEVSAGDRVYYIPRTADRTVLVYYAGPHPASAPQPPE